MSAKDYIMEQLNKKKVVTPKIEKKETIVEPIVTKTVKKINSNEIEKQPSSVLERVSTILDGVNEITPENAQKVSSGPVSEDMSWASQLL